MEPERFDGLVRRLTASGSRRGLLRFVAGAPVLGLLAVLAADDAAADPARRAQRVAPTGPCDQKCAFCNQLCKHKHNERARRRCRQRCQATPPCARKCKHKHSKRARRRCRKRCQPPTPECTTSQDCPAGELCEDGVCIPIPDQCSADTDCDACERCDAGVCVSRCQDDEACVAGACVVTCLIPIPGHVDGTQGLQTAIDDAPGDALQLCPGTWSLTTNVEIARTMSLTGAGASQTVLDGNDQTHILTVAPSTDVHVTGITFTRGFSEDFSLLGGAITNAGRLSLTNCELTANTGDVGGAIYSDGPGGAEQLTVTGCTFSANETPFTSGGAISVIDTSLTMSDSVVVGNISGGFSGGGVHVDALHALDASTQLTNVTFRDNQTSGFGGGLSISASHAQLTSVIFETNQADSGGAVSLWDGNNPTPPRTMSLAGCTLDRNTATSGGGGLHVFESTVTLSSSCVITGNIAPAGGALDADTSQVTLESGITITGNTPPECTGATISDPGEACNAP